MIPMMRNLAIFLGALGIGAMTVSGQEDGLKERVARMAAELEELVKRRAVPADAALVLRTYDVRDLCSPVLDNDLEATNLRPSRYTAPEADEREPRSPYQVDQIIELIRVSVLPESWDSLEGADIRPKNSALFVTTLPAVHERIGKLLGYLREFIGAQVAVDVVAVPVDVAEFAAAPRELSPERTRELLAREPLGSARVVGFDGQQVVQRAGRTRGYVADYNVEVSQGAAIGDPIRAEVFEGCAVEMRGALDRGGQGVVLHLRLERTAVQDPVRQRRTTHGVLDLPALDLTRLETAFWVPLGRTVVAGGGTLGGRSCVFLVTARRLHVGR